MAIKYDPMGRHENYQLTMYPRRQIRDFIEGSTTVKNSAELYLPIPSSWLELDFSSAPSFTSQTNGKLTNKLLPDYLPWNHPNPVYRAYLQRARVPDMTAAAWRGMLGISTNVEGKIELPSKINYLIEEVSPSGDDLQEFYEWCLGEVLTTGKVAIVVDVDVDGEFYLTSYTSESNTNWETKKKKGSIEVSDCTFIEDEDTEVSGEETLKKRYHYIDGVPHYTDYEEGNELESKPLMYTGKVFHKLPIFFAGAVENTPMTRVMPLLGISDIALSIYQKRADLSQAHFLTCNPTLFVFGVGEKETPKVVGSNVIVGIRNPQGQAMYPQTDTSALDHIIKDIEGMEHEAAMYGANFIARGRQRESGESLGRQGASRGANLVKAVKQVGKAMQNALRFIAEMKSINKEEVIFEPSTDFAELELNAQDLTALVSSWLQGGIDHDTLLNNMREAGYVDSEEDNETIKSRIMESKPAARSEDGNPEDDEPEGEEEEEGEEET